MAELIGGAQARKEGLAWLRALQAPGSINVRRQMLVIMGPPGSGKTFMAKALLRSCGRRVVELDAMLLKGRIAAILKQQVPKDVDGTPLGLLIEDGSHFLQEEPRAFDVPCSVPVILTCWNLSRSVLSGGIGSSSPTVVRTYPLNEFQAKLLFQRTRKKLGLLPVATPSRDALASGDMRQIMSAAENYCGVLQCRDQPLSPFEAVRAVLRGQADQALEVNDYACLIFRENYLSLVGDDLASAETFAASLADRDGRGFGWDDVELPAIGLGALLSFGRRHRESAELRVPSLEPPPQAKRRCTDWLLTL